MYFIWIYYQKEIYLLMYYLMNKKMKNSPYNKVELKLEDNKIHY